jgi:hypothetical protein
MVPSIEVTPALNAGRAMWTFSPINGLTDSVQSTRRLFWSPPTLLEISFWNRFQCCRQVTQSQNHLRDFQIREHKKSKQVNMRGVTTLMQLFRPKIAGSSTYIKRRAVLILRFKIHFCIHTFGAFIRMRCRKRCKPWRQNGTLSWLFWWSLDTWADFLITHSNTRTSYRVGRSGLLHWRTAHTGRPKSHYNESQLFQLSSFLSDLLMITGLLNRVFKSFRTESVKKYTLTTINTRWEATQRVMAAKLTRLTHKIEIQLHLVAESCKICSSRSWRQVRKLLDTQS